MSLLSKIGFNRHVQKNEELPIAIKSPPKQGPLSSDALMHEVRVLSHDHARRVVGTAEGHRAADYLADRMREIGLKPANGHSYHQEFATRGRAGEGIAKNVAGLLEGSDPLLKDEVIIVAAHHDVVKTTSAGANDNATGCAGVLAIAEMLAKNPPRRSVLFITFDGEEAGRLGSKHYAKQPLIPVEKTALMVNMDMIGQVHLESGSREEIYQWASDDAFASSALNRAAKKVGGKAVQGYPEQQPEAQFFTTDAEPLYRLSVPTVNFLSGRDLDNHSRGDDMSRVIPERLQQYAILAHQVTVEGANEAQAVKDMVGIEPGGLLPSYPLIKDRRRAAMAVSDEEALRLSGLQHRVPEFRSVARKLVENLNSREIYKITNVDLHELVFDAKLCSEPTLAKVRELRAKDVEAYHAVPKEDLETRRAMQPKLEAMAGIEDILAGALYLEALGKNAHYYLQRVPERLADLHRGAERLGLTAITRGVIDPKDRGEFTTEVNADRAVQLARSTVKELGEAAGGAVRALFNAKDAERNSSAPDQWHVAQVEGELKKAIAELKGADESSAVANANGVRALLRASLAGVRGSADAWVARWAEQNQFTDFSQVIAGLDLAGEQAGVLKSAAKSIEKAVNDDRVDGAAIIAFYKVLAPLALGADKAPQNLDDVRALSKGTHLQEAAETHLESLQNTSLNAAVGAVDNEKVNQLAGLRDAMKAAIELNRLYGFGGLRDSASLTQVKQCVDHLQEATAKIPTAEFVHREFTYWADWLAPFVQIEAKAMAQAATRKELVAEGSALLKDYWRAHTPAFPEDFNLTKGDLAGASQTAAALRKMRMDLDEDDGGVMQRIYDAEEKLEPFSSVQYALDALKESSPAHALRKLELSVNDLVDGKSAESEALVDLVLRLHHACRGDVELARGPRNAALGIVNLRAAINRGEVS